MNKIIGCFALIGLMVVVSVGGCIALIGYGISSIPSIPKYATAAAIEAKYNHEIKLVRDKIITNQVAELDKQLSPEVYAIYKGDEDLLKRYDISSRSHLLVNHGGIGSVHTNQGKVQCLVYELNCLKTDYRIFIYDSQAANQPPAK